MSQAKRSSGRNTPKRSGRPKAADADRLESDIRTAAGELFMQFGFDGTSMDAVAEKASVSKRTLYQRHSDKSALFNAVMYDLLGRSLVPLDLTRYQSGDLGTDLLSIAKDMMTGVMTTEFQAVYRLVVFEAQRRPEFGRWINEARRRPALEVIRSVLARHADELRLPDLDLAAEQFMSVTLDVGLRYGEFGIPMTAAQMQHRLQAAVDLFLHGACRSPAAVAAARRQ
jgi:AcrR family transcriptional regulator